MASTRHTERSTGPPLVDAARRAIRRFALLDGGEGVVVGVSGGQDSVALLDVLATLAPEFDLRLHVAHLNHGLRGEAADADAEYVRELATGLGLPATVERRDVAHMAAREGRSVEAIGREVRYTFLEAVRTRNGLDVIAVGHTASDRAETLLMNLLRGAGTGGLGSLQARRGRVVRPLILATRQDTESHCRSGGLAFRRDEMNLDTDYLRVRIREELLPLLEASYQPRVAEALARTAQILAEDGQLLGDLAGRRLADVLLERQADALALDMAALRDDPRGLVRHVLREAARQVKGDLRDIGFAHWDDAAELVRSGQTGSRVELPGGLSFEVSYDRLLVLAPRPAQRPGQTAVRFEAPGEARSETLGVVVRATIVPRRQLKRPTRARRRADLDLAAAGTHLVLRGPRPGDRFRPLGMDGEKKLQDFFVDAKVPRDQRAYVPIVARADGAILWVAGHRIDDRARLTRRSEWVLRLSAEPLPAR